MSQIIENTKTITITRNKYSSFEDELQYVINHMLENKINGYIVSLKDNSYTIKITDEPQPPAQYSTLLSLDLKWSNIDTLKLSELLELCQNLRNLNLAGLFIGKEGMKILAPVIGQLRELTYLNIANNHICCDGARLLVNALENCPKLKRLNLRKNDLESYGAEALGKLFNKCTVSERDSRTSITGCTITNADSRASITGCTRLECLDICQNFLHNEGAEDIANALLKCECETLSLRELNLTLNYIGSSGAIKLAEVVKMFPQLTINVNNNHIGKDEYESDLNNIGKDALIILKSNLYTQWKEEDEVYSADEVSVPSERDYGFDNDSDYNLDQNLDYNDPDY